MAHVEIPKSLDPALLEILTAFRKCRRGRKDYYVRNIWLLVDGRYKFDWFDGDRIDLTEYYGQDVNVSADIMRDIRKGVEVTTPVTMNLLKAIKDFNALSMFTILDATYDRERKWMLVSFGQGGQRVAERKVRALDS